MAIADITAQRQRIVNEARTWLGTPYHTGGRVKGAGVDCLTLLAEVYAGAGVIPPIDVPYYPHDWHLHRSEEHYLAGLLRYARETGEPPLPGDIALWKFGRCFSHGLLSWRGRSLSMPMWGAPAHWKTRWRPSGCLRWVRVGKAAAAQVFLRILRICHENVMMLRYRML